MLFLFFSSIGFHDFCEPLSLNDYVPHLKAKAFLEVACPDFSSYKVVYVN